MLPTVPPKITPFAFARDLNVGDRISIQCVVVNGDLPLNFTWLKDRIPVTGSSGLRDSGHGLADVTVRQYDDFNSALSVASISTAHTGNYTCKVANEAATVTYTATLHVNGKHRAPTPTYKSITFFYFSLPCFHTEMDPSVDHRTNADFSDHVAHFSLFFSRGTSCFDV